jgi:hypothetical protein
MRKRGFRSLASGSCSATARGQFRRASASAPSLDEACAPLASRLRARFPELEASLAALVDSISDPRDLADPAYLESLHVVRPAFLEYAVDVVELGVRRAPNVPPALFVGIRLAARSGVALDTLVRRYSAGLALFGDVLVEEAENADVSSTDLPRLLDRQLTVFDRLLEAVSEEHHREAKSRLTNQW